MRRERRPASTLVRPVAALGLVVLGACSVPPERSSSELPRSEALDQLVSPTTQPPPTTPTTAPPTEPLAEAPTTVASLPVEVWFVRDDHLVPATRRLALPAAIEALVASLAAGPDEDERERSLRTAIPETEGILVSTASGVATVDLSEEFVNLPASDQVLAIGQIVRTLTSFPGIGQVAFAVNGEPISVVRGDGSSAPGAVSRDDYRSLVA